MLWNSIYDFFIKHVFGGINYTSSHGLILDGEFGGSYQYLTTANTSIEVFGVTMPIGNYFALIATIISISFIVVLCCLFIWKIIKLIGGLIR